jgi:hypothetical protein
MNCRREMAMRLCGCVPPFYIERGNLITTILKQAPKTLVRASKALSNDISYA